MKVQFNIQIENSDLRLIQKVAKERGEGTADFARRALKKELAGLGYLTKSEQKALGVESK